ncbi:hypothetical protein PIB30_010916 [Stylosanthes scabra]|uniref:Uncharacterized protein n=1 Tax=Stylosanthes scabra TaxID=79078 RepID=A0ABU6T7R4_9FABA|nr:hypothetical protein [Stylosanthes scabra]
MAILRCKWSPRTLGEAMELANDEEVEGVATALACWSHHYLIEPAAKLKEQANSKSEFHILNISSTNQEEELNLENSEDQKQEDEDELDVRRIYRELEDRNEVVLQRPPPEPPDLHSLAVRIHNGVEDGAVAMGNVYADIESTKTEEELTINGGCSIFNDTAAEKRKRTLAISMT